MKRDEIKSIMSDMFKRGTVLSPCYLINRKPKYRSYQLLALSWSHQPSRRPGCLGRRCCEANLKADEPTNSNSYYCKIKHANMHTQTHRKVYIARASNRANRIKIRQKKIQVIAIWTATPAGSQFLTRRTQTTTYNRFSAWTRNRCLVKNICC